MAAQLSLTNVPLAARAQVVEGPGDELLARAGLAADQDGRAGGGDRLNLLEHPAQGGALPDDLAEVVLGAGFLFQVGFLLRELVLESLDLLEGEGILNGEGDLIGDELEEADVSGIVGGRLL